MTPNGSAAHATHLIRGAPQTTVWLVGIVFILLGAAILAGLIAIALSIYNDARSRGMRAWPWFVATIIGGWLTVLVWMVVRDQYPDLPPERPPKGDAAP